MKINFRCISVITFNLLINLLVGQISDSTKLYSFDVISTPLENIAENHNTQFDYSDLVSDYSNYLKNPININGDRLYILRDIYLINNAQLINLNSYLTNFGKILSIQELLFVEGFDMITIQQLEPFVCLKNGREDNHIDIKKIKYLRHHLLLRSSIIIEKKDGYSMPLDSAASNKGSVYLGDPYVLYLRYKINLDNKIIGGLTLDKDAGELVFKKNISDTINELIHDKLNNGYDFLSAFISLNNAWKFKRIIIGDYHLEFGQGVTLWTGLSFNKTSEGTQIEKYQRGIRPNTSANENYFLRGIAATFQHRKISLTTFYSRNLIDANIIQAYANGMGISSILESGYHRTINELLDKNTLEVQLAGANIQFRTTYFRAGFTVFNTKLDKPVLPSKYLHKKFDMVGNNFINAGADFAYSLNKLGIFGEFSMSDNGAIASLIGINTYLDSRFFMSASYYNYGVSYHNLYSNPYSFNGNPSNQRGAHIGVKALISPKLSMNGYVEFARFQWFRYGSSTTLSTSKNYVLKVNYISKSKSSCYIKYRYSTKEENLNLAMIYLPEIYYLYKHELKGFISYFPLKYLNLRNRVDFIVSSDYYKNKAYGYMLYQDILYKPDNSKYNITLRYMLFSTQDYDTRVYTYENDVPYAFSIPSFFGSGQRWYLMFRYDINKNLSLWFRIARTIYFNKETIGTGAERINGNTSSEAKIEIKIKV
ncbi:MAG: hypothetical protein P8J47_00625 [Bacteroidales bacterium]|nr:hypothetical protein [Bacteroidales bacterium]